MLYNVTTMASTWHTVATHDTKLLKHQLDAVFALPKEYTFLNYLRCHDDIGWGLDYDFLETDGFTQIPHKKYLNDYLTGKWPGSDARGELYNDDPRLGDARLCGTTASLVGIEAAVYEKDDVKLQAAIDKDVMLHAFLFTQSGIPVLYAGDEIGQLNDYTYHDDPLKREDSRYLHRGDFQWDLAEMRNDSKTRQGKLFHQLKKLIAIRKAEPVFDGGADTWLVETGNDRVLGIGRFNDGDKLIGLFNFSEGEETVYLNEEETYTDLLTNKTCFLKEVSLKPGGFLWAKLTYNKPARKGKEK